VLLYSCFYFIASAVFAGIVAVVDTCLWICIDVDVILSLASLLLTCAELCGFELEKPASFKRPVFFFGCVVYASCMRAYL